jgi:hypothetical protein
VAAINPLVPGLQVYALAFFAIPAIRWLIVKRRQGPSLVLHVYLTFIAGPVAWNGGWRMGLINAYHVSA